MLGLASGVMEDAILDVSLPEVRQVNKRDATQVEAHQKCIFCKFLLFGQCGLGHLFHLANGFCRYSSLLGFCYTSIYLSKRVRLRCVAFLYGFVIDGTKNPHVEGTGVTTYSSLIHQIFLVSLHHVGIHVSKWDVLLFTEPHKTIAGGYVMEHRSMLTIGFQLTDDTVYEFD